MDSGASFFTMLAGMFVVMAIGFLNIPSIGLITLIFYAMFVLILVIALFRKLASKKVNIVKQQDVIIAIKPIGKNYFIAKFYSSLYFIESLILGVFCGCVLVLLTVA